MQHLAAAADALRDREGRVAAAEGQGGAVVDDGAVPSVAVLPPLSTCNVPAEEWRCCPYNRAGRQKSDVAADHQAAGGTGQAVLHDQRAATAAQEVGGAGGRQDAAVGVGADGAQAQVPIGAGIAARARRGKIDVLA